MNKNLSKIIVSREALFVPWVFTKKQFDTIAKYSASHPLSNAEKKSLYTSVRKKMLALESFVRQQKDCEYWINGSLDVMPDRLPEAKSLLDSYSKEYDRVFISGSFLFSKKYNDIDIFVVWKRGYMEKWDKNKHIIFLTEKRLAQPVFQSTSLISISNFRIPGRIEKKRMSLSKLTTTYHEAVIEKMRGETKPEQLRSLIFDHNLFCRNRLLTAKELQEASAGTELADLDVMIKELCGKLFSRSYLYVEMHTYIATLEQSIKKVRPNAHLIRFKNTYEEMIYGRQRGKAEIA